MLKLGLGAVLLYGNYPIKIPQPIQQGLSPNGKNERDSPRWILKPSVVYQDFLPPTLFTWGRAEEMLDFGYVPELICPCPEWLWA